jgi:hypothetical protein
MRLGSLDKEIWLLRNSALSKSYPSRAHLSEVVAAECEAMTAMAHLGPIAIDVPIDLQQIGNSKEAEFVWQLYKRPIDQAFNAMPTLADRIGAPYARMQAILSHSNGTLRLDENVFETYPKALLQTITKKTWKGLKGSEARHHEARKRLCDELGWCELETDHDLDAVLCAVAAGADDGTRIAGAALDALISDKLPDCLNCRAPQGFILLQGAVPTIAAVEQEDFNDWIGARS